MEEDKEIKSENMNTCEFKSESQDLKSRIKTIKFWKPIISIIVGGFIGFIYYSYVGCSTGSCGITSNPFTSVLFGALLGYLLSNNPCRTC